MGAIAPTNSEPPSRSWSARLEFNDHKTNGPLHDVNWLEPSQDPSDQGQACDQVGYSTDSHGGPLPIDQGVLDALGKDKAGGKGSQKGKQGGQVHAK